MESKYEPSVREVSDCLNSFYDGEGRTPFVLSLDGGGIYGLTEAIWLRQMCEQEEGFLVPGQVRIFTGCSAGSLNALLLAMHESPREAVLAGVLEDFWTKSGILANDGAVTRWTGGLTSMYGAEDAIGSLQDLFGDMTLGDLTQNRVLISTFNYSGQGEEDRVFGTPFDYANPDWSAFRPEHMFYMGQPGPVDKPKAGQTRRHWRPKFFDNLALNGAEKHLRVVDIAMAAICLPGIRPFRGGLGDGGLMSADPSTGAIAHLLREWELCVEHGLKMEEAPKAGELSPRQRIRRILADGVKYESPAAIRRDYDRRNDLERDKDRAKLERKELVPKTRLDNPEWVKTTGKGVLLAWLRLLSVGPGQALPAFGYANVDIGIQGAQHLPFNPFDGNFWTRDMYTLDQPSSASEYFCSRLLSDDRFLRLDPDIMKLPTLVASMLTVNPMMRSLVIREIYQQTTSAKSKNAVGIAIEFIRNDPDEELNTGKIWGTNWYHTSRVEDKSDVPREDVGRLPREIYRDRMRDWQAQREAREAARIGKRPF